MKRKMKLLSFLLSLCLMTGLLSVGFSASAENTGAWFTWRDYWGGNSYNVTSMSQVDGYEAVNIAWESTGTSNFQMGLGDWGWDANAARTTLASTDGIAFAIRLDDARKTDDSYFSELDVNLKIPTTAGLYQCSQGSIKTDGTIYQIAMPYSSFALTTDATVKGLDPTIIGSGDIQLELNKYAWEWSNGLKSVNGVVSYLYGYTGTPDEIPMPSLATAIKATFDIDGVADVEADSDGNVTMPEATIEGKQLLGWQDANGALYAAGAKVAITEDTAFTAVAADIALQTGAGIRWAQAETERGIRFETYVTKAALDSIGSSNFELGALILPYADYNADITVETAANYGAVNVVDPKVYGETADGNYRYYTGIVDFERYFAVSQAAMADLKLTAVSYIKVTYADASVGYFYDHPDATNNVRSVAEVARAALADTEFGYTDKQKEILNLYTQYSAETSTPEYRKDDADKITA